MPRPSSDRVITTSAPACRAARRSWPSAGLPAAARSSGVSSPWSAALRIRWIRGSANRSITVLSSSVVSPWVDSSITLPVSRPRSWIRRRKRPNRFEIGTIRTTIMVSRSSEASRSTSSETARRFRSALAEASCLSRDCTMTSSPTRSISSSRRSAGTRTLSPALRASAGALRSSCAGGAVRCSGTRAVAGGRAATGAGAGAAAEDRSEGATSSSGSICSSISSMTKMKTSSMAERGALVSTVAVHARWQSVGISSSSGGTASVEATMRQSPSSRSSASSASGFVPLAMALAGSEKRTRHPGDAGDGAAAATAGAPACSTTRCSSVSSASPSASRPTPPSSISARMWSRASSTAEISSGVARTSPLRTRSKAVSQWWVKAARASKPNMAPEPFRVCRPRNTESTSSRSSERCSRSSRPCSI